MLRAGISLFCFTPNELLCAFFITPLFQSKAHYNHLLFQFLLHNALICHFTLHWLTITR